MKYWWIFLSIGDFPYQGCLPSLRSSLVAACSSLFPLPSSSFSPTVPHIGNMPSTRKPNLFSPQKRSLYSIYTSILKHNSQLSTKKSTKFFDVHAAILLWRFFPCSHVPRHSWPCKGGGRRRPFLVCCVVHAEFVRGKTTLPLPAALNTKAAPSPFFPPYNTRPPLRKIGGTMCAGKKS